VTINMVLSLDGPYPKCLILVKYMFDRRI